MQLAEAVVDAFVWPLRLLGLGPDEEQQHLPLLSVPHNALVNHTIPALSDKEKANLGLSCTVLWQLVASTVTCLKLKEGPGTLCEAARSPRLLQAGGFVDCSNHGCPAAAAGAHFSCNSSQCPPSSSLVVCFPPAVSLPQLLKGACFHYRISSHAITASATTPQLNPVGCISTS